MTIRCCQCGSSKWLACAPGSEAETRVQGNVCLLNPAAEVPLLAWCAQHMPQAQQHSARAAR